MKEEDIRKRAAHDEYIALVRKSSQHLLDRRDTLERIVCPACACRDSRAAFEKFGFTYVNCPECDTVYVNPRPALTDMLKFYANSEATAFWVNNFLKPVVASRRELIFKPRAEFVRSQFAVCSRGTIGDIGAGVGMFIEELRDLWPEARLFAIEPSRQDCAECSKKGIEVIPYAVEHVEGWDGQFDLLSSFELLEHLNDPGLFLAKAHSLLKPGGWLYCTTLNVHGFDIQVLWEQARCFLPPVHLNFFNPDSIALLLHNQGFTDVIVDTPGKLDWDILENCIRKDAFDGGRFFNRLAGRDEASETKAAFQEWLMDNKLSSHMRIIARKAE